jgi:GT2 family glycosyltransferase
MEAPQDNKNAMGSLAIIVLNWNNAKDTIECVDPLTSWNSIKPEIYVVDNASTDNSPEQIKHRFPQITIIKNKKNLGFAGGNNVAIRKAIENRAKSILLLNNDAEVKEADVSRLLATLHGRPDIAAIGPRLRTGSTVFAGGCDIGLHMDTHVRWHPRMGLDGIRKVEYVPGTAFLVRSSAIEEVGLLDEDYFFSGEIADLCRRIYNAGLTCYIDLGAEAIHMAHRPSHTRDLLHTYYSMRNRFLYVKKHYRGQRFELYGRWIGYSLRVLLSSAITGNLGRSRAIMLALCDGVSGRFGDRNGWFIA